MRQLAALFACALVVIIGPVRVLGAECPSTRTYSTTDDFNVDDAVDQTISFNIDHSTDGILRVNQACSLNADGEYRMETPGHPFTYCSVGPAPNGDWNLLDKEPRDYKIHTSVGRTSTGQASILAWTNADLNNDGIGDDKHGGGQP